MRIPSEFTYSNIKENKDASQERLLAGILKFLSHDLFMVYSIVVFPLKKMVHYRC